MQLPAVVGIPGIFTRETWSIIRPDVGRYGIAGVARADSGLRCPYCEGRMVEFVPHDANRPTMARIVQVLERDPDGFATRGILEPVPPGHRVFSCRACVQVFTLAPGWGAVEQCGGMYGS